ncbi:hypothetical protein GCM10010517_44560 [Streptosporangium fragile]|uniref:Uncharacterized protein n=1 Tax=Streptosporangium fragile TaxID=46186 RepID=A0ABN3W0I7_9ACTN
MSAPRELRLGLIASMTGYERRLWPIVTRPLTIGDTIRLGHPTEELGKAVTIAGDCKAPSGSGAIGAVHLFRGPRHQARSVRFVGGSVPHGTTSRRSRHLTPSTCP